MTQYEQPEQPWAPQQNELPEITVAFRKTISEFTAEEFTISVKAENSDAAYAKVMQLKKQFKEKIQ